MPTDQAVLIEALKREFSEVAVTAEWAALSGERQTYSPRVDIAVGPYAIDQRFRAEYDALCSSHRGFLGEVHSCFARNVSSLDAADAVPNLDSVCGLNANARCLLAIEIDNSGSRKHLMGGAVNAAALGRVGLSVAGNENLLRALLKTRRYLRFLSQAGKNTFNTRNLMIVTVKQLQGVLGT